MVRHPAAIRIAGRTAVVFTRKNEITSGFVFDRFDLVSLLHIVRVELLQPTTQGTNGSMTEPAARPHRTALSAKNGPADRQVDHRRSSKRPSVKSSLPSAKTLIVRAYKRRRRRVARMYAELFAGLNRDPRELLRKTSAEIRRNGSRQRHPLRVHL